MTPPAEAVVDLAAAIRRLGRSGLLQRSDLDAICAHLGVSTRREPMVRVHGSLVRESNGFVAYLNEQDSEARQRFTLAHELGHLAFGAEASVPTYHRGAVLDAAQDSALERQCDEFATELLMPAVGVSAIIRSSRPSIRQVLDLTERYEVSIESAAIRIGELTEMPCQVVKWLPDEEGFFCKWERGRPKEIRRGQKISNSKFGVGEAFDADGIVLRHDIESRAFGSKAWRYVLSIILQEATVKMSRRKESHGRRTGPRHKS